MTPSEKNKRTLEAHPDYWKEYYQANKGKYEKGVEHSKNQYCKSGEAGHRRGQVRCVETGKIFESSAEASRSVGLNIRAVSTAIHRNITAGGYHWEYLEV